ncbi:HigA family addiction module antitoxin [Pantoea sp. FN0307]|uniref:HigA family addiction module antitoxin n=1 Tax=Pantoea sp. FN0307 TaxID=3418560 RepID=UPI003CF65290
MLKSIGSFRDAWLDAFFQYATPASKIPPDLQTTLARKLDMINAAASFNVHRNTVSALVNNHRKLTTDMAFRLAKAFDTTVDFWLNIQSAVNIWEVENDTRAQEELNRIGTVSDFLARREVAIKDIA